jgi:hypothetical protein
MTNKLAFYYHSMQIPADNIIEQLKHYLYDNNKYDDFVIFTDIMFPTNTEYSLLPTFYAKFFTGTIVFFDKDSYATNHKGSWLYIHDMQNFNRSDIDYNYNLIIYDKSTKPQYRMVNYNELQQSL